jgi:DNA-binding SARP family transcriptional activator
MLRMITNLEEFIKLDVPFLPEERERRLSQIKETMDKAKVSTSEKFRRVIEAYQIENEYGRTIEAYRGLQTVDGKELTVDFLACRSY